MYAQHTVSISSDEKSMKRFQSERQEVDGIYETGEGEEPPV
jgi:hypothetical protein